MTQARHERRRHQGVVAFLLNLLLMQSNRDYCAKISMRSINKMTAAPEVPLFSSSFVIYLVFDFVGGGVMNPGLG